MEEGVVGHVGGQIADEDAGRLVELRLLPVVRPLELLALKEGLVDDCSRVTHYKAESQKQILDTW